MHFPEVYKYMMFCCTVYPFFLVPDECEIRYLQIIYYTEMQIDYPNTFLVHIHGTLTKKKWWSKCGVWLTIVVCLDICYNDLLVLLRNFNNNRLIPLLGQFFIIPSIINTFTDLVRSLASNLHRFCGNCITI